MRSDRIHHFQLLAILFLFALAGTPCAWAQDDSYEHVRFVNKGDSPVKISVWNPRDSRPAWRWAVGAGESLDLADEKGEKLRIGVYSSLIKVGDHPEQNVLDVTVKTGAVRVATWNGEAFEAPSGR